MNLHFTYESRDTLKSFSLFLNVRTNSKLNMEHVQRYVRKRNFEKSRRRSHSLDNAKFGHFKVFFFLQRTQKNLRRFMMHVHSYCSAY